MIRLKLDGFVQNSVLLRGQETATLLEEYGSDLFVKSMSFASVAGDTLTLDTYDGSTAYRLARRVIAPNGNGEFRTSFVLKLGQALRGTLSTGNDTFVMVNFVRLMA